MFDGTMMHAPFVEQTIKMARDHTHIYRRGPGYHSNETGVSVERYWEIDRNADPRTQQAALRNQPYHIE